MGGGGTIRLGRNGNSASEEKEYLKKRTGEKRSKQSSELKLKRLFKKNIG